MPKLFGYSFDGEEYYGHYTSREKALAAAKADEDYGGHCWTAQMHPPKPGEYGIDPEDQDPDYWYTTEGTEEEHAQ